jgi:hypothetical protein
VYIFGKFDCEHLIFKIKKYKKIPNCSPIYLFSPAACSVGWWLMAGAGLF